MIGVALGELHHARGHNPGMRRGELLGTRWSDVDLKSGLLTIPRTKTGISRRIPLTPRAIVILTERNHATTAKQEDRVFCIKPNAFQLAWRRCRLRASKEHPAITSLRFHDLRHEAVSRFFELGLSTAEVALISGHRDMRMLFRYTHLKPESIVAKLRNPQLSLVEAGTAQQVTGFEVA